MFTLFIANSCFEAGWQSCLTGKVERRSLLFALLSSFSFMTFMTAGRYFFAGKVRQGTRFLVAALVAVGLILILDYFFKMIVFLGP
jgi:hypothetical protein